LFRFRLCRCFFLFKHHLPLKQHHNCILFSTQSSRLHEHHYYRGGLLRPIKDNCHSYEAYFFASQSKEKIVRVSWPSKRNYRFPFSKLIFASETQLQKILRFQHFIGFRSTVEWREFFPEILFTFSRFGIKSV
jgi:hypothetical protein